VGLFGIAVVGFLATRDKPLPDVLLITLDTVRADMVGDAGETPAIATFLRDATWFKGARTVVPLTLPAHASLFSGLLPAHHGIHDNVAPPIAERQARSYTLIAEELRARGYATAAFIARAVLAARTGIASGFEYRHDNVGAGTWGYVTAQAQVDAALTWMKKRDADKPAFVWVHLFDAHFPYRPFAGDGQREGTTAADSAKARYRGEIRRMDAAVERLLAAVDEDTVVVIVSDHGEALGEHGEETHGMLCYGATVDAFLAARGPRLRPGEVDHEPRSLCDVAPTLRVWCGLPKRESDGAALFEKGPAVVVSESLFTWRIHGWGQCFAAFDGRYSLVESGATIRLYDRALDPQESRPKEPRGHPAYERLDRALQVLRSHDASPHDAAAELDSVPPYASLRRPGSVYLSRTENARLPNPRRRVRLWAQVERASGLIESAASRGPEALGEVVQTLAILADKEPHSPLPFAYLARAQSEMGRLTGDRAWFRVAARSLDTAIARGHVQPSVRALAEDYHRLGQ